MAMLLDVVSYGTGASLLALITAASIYGRRHNHR